MGFSKDFLWGAASAAYQIEGAYNEDGKALSIWDVASATPGKIVHGETGNVACDHYHHMKEDVAMMKEMGLKAYRFSISWPRVIPKGTGAVNEKGLQFYSDLADELIASGIEPLITLYHWDLPQALQEQGGWKNPQMVDWFSEYTRVVVRRLSDRVKYWITFNEPQLFVGAGLAFGAHAPFETNTAKDVIWISHNVLKAHGMSVKTIRAEAKQDVMIGMAPTGGVYLPASAAGADVEDARKKSFSFNPSTFSFQNSWWADPVFLGDYPKEAYEAYPEEMKIVTKEDLELISQPLDFYGFNVYQADATSTLNENGYDEYSYQGSPHTMMGWNVTPEVLYWSSKYLYERYQKPVLVTENGIAAMDWVSLDGGVHDKQREDFIHRYLLELKHAVEDGIEVMGYLYWSVMDNMEWTFGYDKRFGLIYVDYNSHERIIKDSAYWYKTVIDANGENL